MRTALYGWESLDLITDSTLGLQHRWLKMPSRYPIKMSFQVSLKMQVDLSDLPEINVAAVCRKALQAEIDLHKGDEKQCSK